MNVCAWINERFLDNPAASSGTGELKPCSSVRLTPWCARLLIEIHSCMTQALLAYGTFIFFLYFLFLATCARLSWSQSAYESTLNSSIVSCTRVTRVICSVLRSLVNKSIASMARNDKHSTVPPSRECNLSADNGYSQTNRQTDRQTDKQTNIVIV